MVQLLTAETFYAYGAVLGNTQGVYADERFVPGETVEGTRDVDGRSPIFQYCRDHPVFLENTGEPVLLFLSPDTTFSRREIFLLDKPVILKPGILFCLNGLHGSCAVSYLYPKDARFQEVVAPDDGQEPLILPKVNIQKIFTLFYQEKEKGFVFRGESHDFWELTYVDKGFLHTMVDGKEWVLQQRELIFYGKDQHHMQSAEGDAPVSFITITFDMDLADELILLDRKFTVDKNLAQLIDKILYEKEHSIFYSEDLIACYLKELIIRLIRAQKLKSVRSTPHSSYKMNLENDLIGRVTEYIEQNITRRLTVGEIAAHVSVSQSYLSMLFKKHKKMTLIEFVNHARLERCKEHIREGKYSITEIACMMGYTSVHYLSRQFKNTVGITPSEYARATR